MTVTQARDSNPRPGKWPAMLQPTELPSHSATQWLLKEVSALVLINLNKTVTDILRSLTVCVWEKCW